LARSVSEAEVRQLLAVARPNERALIALLCFTGSLRHTFASLGRVAGESAFNMSRMMGHSRSTLIDQVLASAAENVTARALGVKPPLRVIEGGNPRDVRRSLDDAAAGVEAEAASG
jgi:hypothetical protein